MTKFEKFKLVSYENTMYFGKNQRNRKIKRGHLQRIKKQCLASMETMPPITINIVTSNIIDGQHRLLAFQELVEDGSLDANTKIKVMFVSIPEDEEIEAIIAANTNSQNWAQDDYIGSYAAANMESYVKLTDWCLTHSLTNESGKPKYRYGAAIIKGKGCSAALKKGEFSFDDEEETRANEIHAEMLEIIDIFNMKGKGSWIEPLAISWASVRAQHPFKVWIKEFRLKKKRFFKLPKENCKDWDNIFAQTHLAIDKKKEITN